MADSSTSSDDQQVFRLTYRSRLRLQPHERKPELGAIFSTARSKNTRAGVTGALLVWEDQVVQSLEGDEETVRALYDVIERDPRHDRVEMIGTETAPRVFGRWSMARVTEGDEPDIPLLMNKDKGGISPAAPRATTPEQDAALDAMREHVRT